MNKRVFGMSLFYMCVSLIAPGLTVAIALAAAAGGNFVADHPDAAQWVMAALVSLTCIMAMWIGAGIVQEQKQIRKDVTEAMTTLSKTVSENYQEFAKLKQHCDDVEKYGIRRMD